MLSEKQASIYQDVYERLEELVTLNGDGMLTFAYPLEKISGFQELSEIEALAVSDFKRSLDLTNRKIQAGELSGELILHSTRV